MTDRQWDGAPMVSDEVLTAYLDGELMDAERDLLEAKLREDDVLRARLDRLSAATAGLRRGFEPLLDAAPTDRLQAFLDTLSVQERPAEPSVFAAVQRLPVAANSAGVRWNRRAFAGMLAASVLAGFAGDRLLLALTSRRDEAEDSWREAVAQYMTLYARDTVAIEEVAAERLPAQLTAINQRLGSHLTAQAVTLPGLVLVRTQIFDYDGKPLAQVLYRDNNGLPLAFCLFGEGAGRQAPTRERRHDMPITWWSGDKGQALVIGHGNDADIAALATTLKARLDQI